MLLSLFLGKNLEMKWGDAQRVRKTNAKESTNTDSSVKKENGVHALVKNLHCLHIIRQLDQSFVELPSLPVSLHLFHVHNFPISCYSS